MFSTIEDRQLGSLAAAWIGLRRVDLFNRSEWKSEVNHIAFQAAGS
jgi:hypothetical protein